MILKFGNAGGPYTVSRQLLRHAFWGAAKPTAPSEKYKPVPESSGSGPQSIRTPSGSLVGRLGRSQSGRSWPFMHSSSRWIRRTRRQGGAGPLPTMAPRHGFSSGEASKPLGPFI